MSDRQTGRTTAQMSAAPLGAVFVWLNSNLIYPKALAAKLGRDDLEVRPLSWLNVRNTRGRRFNYSEVVVDHAVPFDSERYAALNILLTNGCKVYGAKRAFLQQINEQAPRQLPSEILDELAHQY
jgi:hypothetical protein